MVVAAAPTAAAPATAAPTTAPIVVVVPGVVRIGPEYPGAAEPDPRVVPAGRRAHVGATGVVEARRAVAHHIALRAADAGGVVVRGSDRRAAGAADDRTGGGR